MEQNIYTTQIDIMEKTINELQEFHNSTVNLSGSLRSKLARFIDERILIETYESYERAFNNYDKINNQKQVEGMLQGAVKYITALVNLFTKELNDNEMGHKVKGLTGFLSKLSKDIVNVQQGLSAKSKKMQEEIMKEQDQNKKKDKEPKSSTSTTKRGNLGSTNRSVSPQKKMPGDVLENEMKDFEK